MICKVDWCDKEANRKAAQMCEKHYYQQYRHGKIFAKTSSDSRAAIIDGDIAKIPLGAHESDGYALVDKEFAYLAKDKWCKSLGYAVRTTDLARMHRIILSTPAGMVTDHINRDRLDNRTANLRNCTQAENSRNKGIRPSNKLGVKGVIWDTKTNKYKAIVKLNYKQHVAGYFDDLQEAAKAYRALAKQLHGEFAEA